MGVVSTNLINTKEGNESNLGAHAQRRPGKKLTPKINMYLANKIAS